MGAKPEPVKYSLFLDRPSTRASLCQERYSKSGYGGRRFLRQFRSRSILDDRSRSSQEFAPPGRSHGCDSDPMEPSLRVGFLLNGAVFFKRLISQDCVSHTSKAMFLLSMTNTATREFMSAVAEVEAFATKEGTRMRLARNGATRLRRQIRPHLERGE